MAGADAGRAKFTRSMRLKSIAFGPAWDDPLEVELLAPTGGLLHGFGVQGRLSSGVAASVAWYSSCRVSASRRCAALVGRLTVHCIDLRVPSFVGGALIIGCSVRAARTFIEDELINAAFTRVDVGRGVPPLGPRGVVNVDAMLPFATTAAYGPNPAPPEFSASGS